VPSTSPVESSPRWCKLSREKLRRKLRETTTCGAVKKRGKVPGAGSGFDSPGSSERRRLADRCASECACTCSCTWVQRVEGRGDRVPWRSAFIGRPSKIGARKIPARVNANRHRVHT
jgi:hypothetical protein